MSDRTKTGACRFCGQTKLITLSEDEWLDRIQKTNDPVRLEADVLENQIREGQPRPAARSRLLAVGERLLVLLLALGLMALALWLMM